MASSPRPAKFVTRASALMRLYGGWVVLVGFVWAAIGILASEPTGGGLGMVLAGILAVVYGVRVMRARVVVLCDEVRVYNRFRNYRVRRSDVSAVDLRHARRTLWQTLRLPRSERTVGVLNLTSRDEIHMYATERNNYGSPDGFFGPPKNGQQVEALRAHLGLPSSEKTLGGSPTP